MQAKWCEKTGNAIHYATMSILKGLLQLNLGLSGVHDLPAPRAWTLMSSRFR